MPSAQLVPLSAQPVPAQPEPLLEQPVSQLALLLAERYVPQLVPRESPPHAAS